MISGFRYASIIEFKMIWPFIAIMLVARAAAIPFKCFIIFTVTLYQSTVTFYQSTVTYSQFIILLYPSIIALSTLIPINVALATPINLALTTRAPASRVGPVVINHLLNYLTISVSNAYILDVSLSFGSNSGGLSPVNDLSVAMLPQASSTYYIFLTR